MKLFVVIEEQGNPVFDILAREALSAAAPTAKIEVEISTSPYGHILRIPVTRDKNDILLIVSDNVKPLDESDYKARFNGVAVYNSGLQDVLNDASAVLDHCIKAEPDQPYNDNTSSENLVVGGIGYVQNIIAITSCPTGIAHTFMAADALKDSAKALGINIRIETQGSVGAGTPLTDDEIKNADLVIVAADREVDRSRFIGKYIYTSTTNGPIRKGVNYINEAIANATLQKSQTSHQKAPKTISDKLAAYKHLMTGVSFMLPFVVAGGLLIALAYALGGVEVANTQDSFAHTLYTIGHSVAFFLIVPVLAGYIAFSIADRPGLGPGMIGGFIAQQFSAGFIGGIIAGFLAGYVVLLLLNFVKLPRNLAGLMPVLIVPLIATLIVGLTMIYIVGNPVAQLNLALEAWLQSIAGSNAVLFGFLLGAMMACDLGGPVNKAAYVFSIFMVSRGFTGPIAAAMVAGMTPPIALACATIIFPNRFTDDEHNSKFATFILGLSFISEGAIPYAARDPFRVIPSLMVGSAVAGAIAFGVGVHLAAPHGGMFLLLIPGVVTNYLGYFIALIVGIVISTLCLGFLKKPLSLKKTIKI